MSPVCLRLAALCATLSLPAQLGAIAHAETAADQQKINAYVECLNRLSERSYDSRARYFSWVDKKGPTGKERIIYGLYTIYDTTSCKADVAKVSTLEPRDSELEAAASAYAEAVSALEPLLKEADDYYEQENYKDDKMAKGKALHPRLVAAWDAFAAADVKLRNGVDAVQDKQALVQLAEIERTDGRKARYLVQAVMIRAKKLMRAFNTEKADLARITEALSEYEAIVNETDTFAGANRDSKIGSSFLSGTKTYLGSAKKLMRRIRDKEPYSSGDKMLLQSGSGAWMVEGSPARVLRDYNSVVESYNRGANF